MVWTLPAAAPCAAFSCERPPFSLFFFFLLLMRRTFFCKFGEFSRDEDFSRFFFPKFPNQWPPVHQKNNNTALTTKIQRDRGRERSSVEDVKSTCHPTSEQIFWNFFSLGIPV